MSATNFNLRGIDAKLMKTLKSKAAQQSVSVNSLILKYIEQSVGYSRILDRPTYNDLEHLAGTWQASDAKEFKSNTKDFEKIDKDIWS